MTISSSMESCCGESSRCREPTNPSTSSLGPGRVSLCFTLTFTMTSLLARAIGTPQESSDREEEGCRRGAGGVDGSWRGAMKDGGERAIRVSVETSETKRGGKEEREGETRGR